MKSIDWINQDFNSFILKTPLVKTFTCYSIETMKNISHAHFLTRPQIDRSILRPMTNHGDHRQHEQ